MIACCGLNCSKCGAYIAKLEDNDGKRVEVAKNWSAQFKEEIKSLSVNNIDIWPILCHIFKQVEERDKIDPGGKYGENSIMGSL